MGHAFWARISYARNDLEAKLLGLSDWYVREQSESWVSVDQDAWRHLSGKSYRFLLKVDAKVLLAPSDKAISAAWETSEWAARQGWSPHGLNRQKADGHPQFLRGRKVDQKLRLDHGKRRQCFSSCQTAVGWFEEKCLKKGQYYGADERSKDCSEIQIYGELSRGFEGARIVTH